MVEKARTLGFTVAFAIGLGTMIAAGIFSLSGTAVASIGSSAVISFVIAALVASITAGAYSEFASIYSESGGGYLFTSRTLENDYVVYTEGIMLFLGYSATTAFYLATMGEWVHEFVYPIAPWIVGTATAILLAVLNARGTEESGSFQVLVTGAKVAVLLAFIGGAAAYRPPTESAATFAGGFTADLPGIAEIAALAFITFFGFSAIAASAGEIIAPRKTVPRAIAASIVTVTILYTLVIVAMVNSPVPAEVVAEQGETAMGVVAEAFLGPAGRALIVAGAIFSMVSASNASILAASRIGYLMGREGRALRRFHLIHRDWGTPIWAVGACMFTIIALIVTFVGIFPGHGSAPFGINLGLQGLTGFANLNLLVPLSVVNVALIVSRRRQSDLDRPFRLPLSPVLPALGIAANLALIASLPLEGIVAGVIGIVSFVVIYAIWGGGLAVEEIMTAVTEPPESVEAAASPAGAEEPEEGTTVLVPVAREEDARDQVALADALGPHVGDGPVTIRVVHITNVPEQTPSDAVDTRATQEHVDRLKTELEDIDVSADVTVEGYVSQNIAFTILQLAREWEADILVMGYPQEHRGVVERVQHRTSCDVVYTYGMKTPIDLSVINLGAGGGPNHNALLPLIDKLGIQGNEIHVIRVDPEIGGTPEQVAETLDGLRHADQVQVHNVEERNVAKGLVKTAEQTGGVLFIGASRDLLLKQWLFGSTPDRVVDLAEEAGVPVIIYRGRASVRGTLGDAAFIAYRFLRILRRR